MADEILQSKYKTIIQFNQKYWFLVGVNILIDTANLG